MALLGRLALLAVALVGAACAGPAVRPTSTPDLVDDGMAPVNVTEAAIVVFVVDGDTIRVQSNGEELNEYAVRYIGIDAPERESEPLWAEATEANARLIAGREVFMEPDVSDTDRHGRLLRHVWLPTDDGWVNIGEEIVGLGLADARSYPPDTLWDAEYAAAEAEARASDLGIWGLP